MNIRNRVLVCIAAACAACGGNGGGGAARHLIYEGQNSGSPPGFEIWDVVLENGAATGTPVNLTQSAGDDMEADWNQQERKIAFASDRAGDFNLYVMNADGSNVVQVTSNTHMQRLPSWDPTGNEIAFATDEDGDFEIFVVRPNGHNPRQLTHNDCVDSDPAWSPDGTKIAYVTNCDPASNLEIHVMGIDGTGDVRLTNLPTEDDFHTSWSADSVKIAFESVPIGGSAHVNPEISIMNADGSGLNTLVIDASTRDLVHPAWEPSGDRLAVARIDATGDYNLFMISTAGGTASLAMDQPLTQWSPVWGAPAP
jgi:Tol biopolymer transport system component